MEITQEENPKNETVVEMASATDTTSVEAAVATPVAVTSVWYKNTQLLIAIIVTVLLLIGAGYYAYSMSKTGDAVAIVNGTEIYRKEFEESIALIKQSAATQGVHVDDATVATEIQNQALETLIDNTLLLTASEKAGFSAGAATIQAKYDELAEQLGGQEALTARMTEVGLTEEKLRKNIKERILADAYIESETDIENLVVTDAEIEAFITTFTTDDAELPPIEEIRPQIEAQLLSQKQQGIVAGLIAKLRETATIERMI